MCLLTHLPRALSMYSKQNATYIPRRLHCTTRLYNTRNLNLNLQMLNVEVEPKLELELELELEPELELALALMHVQ